MLRLGLLVGSESDGSKNFEDLVSGASHGLDLNERVSRVRENLK